MFEVTLSRQLFTLTKPHWLTSVRPQMADVMVRTVDKGQLSTAEVYWQTNFFWGAGTRGIKYHCYTNTCNNCYHYFFPLVLIWSLLSHGTGRIFVGWKKKKKIVLFTVRWSVPKFELENRRLIYLASTIGNLTGLSEYYNRQHLFFYIFFRAEVSKNAKSLFTRRFLRVAVVMP